MNIHHFTFRIPGHKMMKIPQLLLIAAATLTANCKPEGRIPFASRPTKSFYGPPKVSYGSFQTFGASFGGTGTPIPSQIPLAPPTVQSFAGSFIQTGANYPESNENYPEEDENFRNPPVGEDFLRIHKHSHTNQNLPRERPSYDEEQNFQQRQDQNFPAQEESFPREPQRPVAPQKPVAPQVTRVPQQPSAPPRTQNFPASVQNLLPTADRRQGIPATPAVSFRTPSNNLEEILEDEWNTFKITFNKTYPTFDEERQRREIFIENRNKVSRFNQEYGNGRHSFVQKLNQYADLLNHEFNGQVNGLNRTRKDGTAPERRPSSYVSSANVQLPTYVDWREAGAVTPVRSQGSCGACYAFASAGALEGQVFRKTGRLQELSPQNLIDCTQSYTNSGCVGGLMEFAFEYIKDNRGIDTENAYPFEARDGQDCRYREDGYGAHVTGYVIIDEGDETALQTAVATLGPVAIGIDAHADSFQFYSNGVYFEPLCSSDLSNINHAVLVVGYGTEPNGQQYWLIKNSYGPEWGIGGYMKLAKNSSNHCAVASYASYPLI